MAEFCTQCGNALEENQKFCVNCGTPVKVQLEKKSTSNNIAPQNKSQKAKKPKEKVKKQSTTTAAKKLISRNSFAPAMSGESMLAQTDTGSLFAGGMAVLSPIKVIIGGFKSVAIGLKSSFKDKKKLVLAIIFMLVWVLLTILPILGVSSGLVKALSFLTFSRGGMSNNPLHMIGGLVGKGVFVYFLSSLILPIFRKQNPFKPFASGTKTFVSKLKNIGANSSAILLGGGIALILYNFMAGNAWIGAGMAAISGTLLSLRAIGNTGGFLMRLLNSFTHEFNKKNRNILDVKTIIVGMSVGFALSIPLSLIPLNSICYLLGVVAIIASLIVLIIKLNKKEEKVK